MQCIAQGLANNMFNKCGKINPKKKCKWSWEKKENKMKRERACTNENYTDKLILS